MGGTGIGITVIVILLMTVLGQLLVQAGAQRRRHEQAMAALRALREEVAALRGGS